MANGGQTELLTLYGIVFEALRHESNGIWQRFNIALGMNLALFAGFGFVCFGENPPVNWRAFGIAISVGGALITVWSCLVLRQLWERHWHWRSRLEEIQQSFPSGWVRPIDQARRLTVNLTEPYFWLLGIAWLAAVTILAVCPEVFRIS